MAPRNPSIASEADSNVTAALRFEGVGKLYGHVPAVVALDLAVRQGEFLTLLGPSGSGKTTTLRLVAGFIQPSAGTIYIKGQDVTNVPPHKRDVGVVFQNYALFPHLTASENIGFPLRMRGRGKVDQRHLVAEAMSLVQLDGLGGRYPRELSGGQQQRVALARAIVYEPRLLLMDEPLGALDKKLRESLQLEIKRLHQELGITVLYVTHDQEEALVLSDRIALFSSGRIVQLGSPTDLYQRPTSVFSANFLGEANVFPGRLDRYEGGWRLISGPWTFYVPGSLGSAIHAAASVALVVRPEHLRLSGEQHPESRQTQITGRIRQVIYLGPYVKYEIEAGEQTIVSRSEVSGVERFFQPGESVFIHWLPDNGLLVETD